MPEILKDWFCGHCGSNDVISDATARFDPNRQEWVHADTQDGTYCNNCEYEGLLFHFEKYDPAIMLFNDQPVTCPHCGGRTEWTEMDSAKQQLHKCLNPECAVWFRVEEDPEREQETGLSKDELVKRLVEDVRKTAIHDGSGTYIWYVRQWFQSLEMPDLMREAKDAGVLGEDEDEE